MRAVVMQHEEHEGPGMLGPALETAGFTLIKRFRSVKREDLDAELVVVLGGPMGVYEAERHPFLAEELALLTERLAFSRPVLGLCLGAQLLAAAAGSEVFVGKNGLEVGVAPVRWTKEGLADPVLGGARPKATVAHWHQDTFKPVPGATLLASTDRYTQQAFRLGDSYGLQFHLELTADEMERWLVQGTEELVELYGKNVDELRAQVPKLRAAEGENRELLERLAHHFARVARAAR
ncbi:glutamine amidotransferase-related protein [Cystobacter ferrugineus]|uniref:Glutamine amidotransferase n=1 Tax=Cystobacter ferrugineus TaxID=83449 RepID=A0A1L9BHW2_9BACT|nr:glutamine amidotransferase [Cystobacter ferrugineus]OJH41861.1 glutamine amidotransferase [Cystobacter ferrugineus]